MSLIRLDPALRAAVAALESRGTAKGAEDVITDVVAPSGDRGPRYRIDGHGERLFLRMNANGYLGLARCPELIVAEEAATRRFGAGPGAVRFISGTMAPHVALERRLAAFHGREAAMIFSSAYAAMVGLLAPLITPETVVISDALNHNCIINAIRLSRPGAKRIYDHLDFAGLEAALQENAGRFARALVITDGVFSMRGDHAPLDELAAVCAPFDERFAEGVVTVVDDSHGVGAFGATGRGTEEVTGGRADILVGTLGKAFGVNGGYVASSAAVTAYLRETAPMYIYSNPITAGEAAAASAAVSLVDSPEGRARLEHLAAMTRRFEAGLIERGFETIPSPHPVVPLMVRDTAKTSALVAHLKAHGVLATGLNYPVVPKGDESIRFQISADHTPADVDEALAVLARFTA